MDVFVICLAALYGLVIGSFVNAVVYRVPRKESLNTRSHCPECGHMIRGRHNIPLFSWLSLRGKCFDCGTPIHGRYPAVELTGAVFYGGLVAYLMPTLSHLSLTARILAIIGFLVLAGASLALTLIDIEYKLLPSVIIYPTALMVVGLLLASSLLMGDLHQLLRALAGSFILGAFYFIVWLIKPGAMGFGDVRLSLLLGFALAWLSWPALSVGFFAPFFIASIFALGLLLAGKAKKKMAIAFGPWMLIGAWLGIFLGSQIIDIYLHIGGLQ